jgi:TolB-like protein
VTKARHRLTAIIFTDIAGYTSLMGENESEAMEILRKNQEIHQRVFAQFNCLFNKQMGDGFMAVFNSLIEATYASAHIVEQTKKENIPVRVGIHEGEVISEGNDYYGDGVNIASRIEQASKPGYIYVSENASRNLVNKKGINVSFVKETTLKNVKEPVKLFEVTIDKAYLPDGLNLGESLSGKITKSRWKLVAALLLLLGAIYVVQDLTNDRQIRQMAKMPEDILLPGNTIAVLPFEYRGSDPEMAYLGAGFADGVLTKLSWLKDFMIISRSSSFKFPSASISVAEISEKLGAQMILEGSYQVMDNQIRINVKLLEAEEERILLADSYSGEMGNIFELQDLVANGLFRRLGKSEIITGLKINYPDDPVSLNAFRFYQEGMGLLKENYLYKSMIRESRSLFQEAIREDPDYIDPYIGMVESYLADIFFGYNSIYYIRDSMEAYVSKVRALNPRDSRLLMIDGIVKFYELDRKEGIDLLKKGIEANPNYPWAYFYLSWQEVLNNDPVAHRMYINRAIAQDPLNSSYKSSKIIHSIWLSEFDTAHYLLEERLAEQPGDNMALFLKGFLLCQQKRYEEALRSLLQRSVGDTTNFLVAYTHGMVGNTSEALKIVGYLERRSEQIYIPATMLAIAYLGLDDRENMYKWLDRAYHEKGGWYGWMLLTLFEPLHQEQRFLDLLKKFDLYETFLKYYKFPE